MAQAGDISLDKREPGSNMFGASSALPLSGVRMATGTIRLGDMLVKAAFGEGWADHAGAA